MNNASACAPKRGLECGDAVATRACDRTRAQDGTGSTKSKRGRWSWSEQARLRELYGLRDVAAIARELKRPVASVLRTAQRLFQAEVKSGPWTASETLELKRYLGATTPEVIARILGRRVDEVEAQIFELGRIRGGGSWTRAEIVDLQAHPRDAHRRRPLAHLRLERGGDSRTCPEEQAFQGQGLPAQVARRTRDADAALEARGARTPQEGLCRRAQPRDRQEARLPPP